MPLDLHEIARRFGFHKPRSLGTENALDTIRQACAQLADVIVQETPECREQSNALTRLEEVMFHAVAARVRPSAQPQMQARKGETGKDFAAGQTDASADYATGGEGSPVSPLTHVAADGPEQITRLCDEECHCPRCLPRDDG